MAKHIPYTTAELEQAKHRMDIHLSADKIRFDDGKCSECGERVSPADTQFRGSPEEEKK